MLTASQARLPGSVMRPGAPRPAAPQGAIHEGILDHMLATRDEIVEHARAVIPAEQIRRPAPREIDAFYEWLGELATGLDENARLATDAILYRHALEHALRERDGSVIQPHRCLNCRCFSLMWQAALQAAVCTNLRCADEDGRPSQFTLGQIAENAVENLSFRAAT
jgi:hypothetical protein